jgi:mono/diheme cytochrome c family protein
MSRLTTRLRRKNTLIGCVVALLLPPVWVASASDTPPTGNVANGQRLFMSYGCYACHGTTGAGGGIAGPRIAPNPLPLIGVKSKLRTASGRMPVFSEAVLKDSEIIDIYAYLQSIPIGRSAREIELLNH